MSKLKEIWKNQALLISNEVVKERVDVVPNLYCYVGTISFSKAKIFLLELDESLLIHSNYLMRFVGVEIQILPINSEKKELAIILLEDDLSDIFTYFIEDIINSLSITDNQDDAILIISRKIGYWKKLFSKLTGGLLTSQQQSGLFGELYFLKLLFENLNSEEKVIKSWQAPSGANQDFYIDGNAVEVKTSRSNSPSIKISNEYQLDISGLKHLYVAFYKLNEYPGSEYTLLNIITEIRQHIENREDILFEFNTKLESLGISPDDESEYNITSFTVRSEKYYFIAPEFPKITPDSIDNAISKVSYEIAPNDCAAFEISFNSILTEL